MHHDISVPLNGAPSNGAGIIPHEEHFLFGCTALSWRSVLTRLPTRLARAGLDRLGVPPGRVPVPHLGLGGAAAVSAAEHLRAGARAGMCARGPRRRAPLNGARLDNTTLNGAL